VTVVGTSFALDIAALVVSAFAALIAAAALVFTRQADKREAWRFQKEKADASAERAARPSAGYLGRQSGHPRAYRFRVANIGKADARDLKAFLIDTEGNIASEASEQYLAEGTGLLGPRERTEVELVVSETAVERNPLFLRFEWTDDLSLGIRQRTSEVQVPTQ
jgi:hypothetical protein